MENPLKAISDKVIASTEESKERIKICESCEIFNHDSRRCSPKELNGKRGCNCFMDVKTKLKHSKCPVGKW